MATGHGHQGIATAPRGPHSWSQSSWPRSCGRGSSRIRFHGPRWTTMIASNRRYHVRSRRIWCAPIGARASLVVAIRLERERACSRRPYVLLVRCSTCAAIQHRRHARAQVRPHHQYFLDQRREKPVARQNYSAAKAASLAFTKALAQESARSGITVNAICPGYINTEMVQAVPRGRAGEIHSAADPDRATSASPGNRALRRVSWPRTTPA